VTDDSNDQPFAKERNLMSDMKDRVALVTGASSGIGRATAGLFAARGARVVVAARRQDELDSLVGEIEARGGTASAVTADVSISADVGRLVDHAITTYGRLDYAINNAGIEGGFAGITELEEGEWDRVLGINLKGTFLCMQKEARVMLAAWNGAVSDSGTTEDALTITSAEGINPLVATFRRTVTGAKGTLVLTGNATVNLANPAAAEVEGTWQVESATAAYAGHSGGGTVTGSADMTLPQPRGNVRYAGHLVTAG
jgi:NAD(P)-dependent dehydrogenase (short-subunit alcohol dehydrogenase family)